MKGSALVLTIGVCMGACNPSALVADAGGADNVDEHAGSDELGGFWAGAGCAAKQKPCFLYVGAGCSQGNVSGSSCYECTGRLNYNGLDAIDTWIISTYTAACSALAGSGSSCSSAPHLSACGHSVDGTYLYVADANHFGGKSACGMTLRVTNPANGRSCVVIVDDSAPDQCIDSAAASTHPSAGTVALLDASPLLISQLGIRNSGWENGATVTVQTTSDPYDPTQCDNATGNTPGSGAPVGSGSVDAGTSATSMHPAASDGGSGVPTPSTQDLLNKAQPACNLDAPSCKGADANAVCQANFQGNTTCCVADGTSPASTGTNLQLACCSFNGVSGGICAPQAPVGIGNLCAEQSTGCIPQVAAASSNGQEITAPVSCAIQPSGREVCCIPDGAIVPGATPGSTANANWCCSYTGSSYQLDNGAACQPSGIAPPQTIATGQPCFGSQQCADGAKKCQATAGILTCK